MKRNLLVGFMIAVLSPLAHADYTFYADKIDSCNAISGYWSGSGKATNWLIGECSYNGSGVISPLDNMGRFTIEVVADKKSGSFICPKHATEKLSGSCVDGVLILITQYGNISGNFSENAGSAEGTLKVSPGVTAEVSVHFSREHS